MKNTAEFWYVISGIAMALLIISVIAKDGYLMFGSLFFVFVCMRIGSVSAELDRLELEFAIECEEDNTNSALLDLTIARREIEMLKRELWQAEHDLGRATQEQEQ